MELACNCRIKTSLGGGWESDLGRVGSLADVTAAVEDVAADDAAAREDCGSDVDADGSAREGVGRACGAVRGVREVVGLAGVRVFAGL